MSEKINEIVEALLDKLKLTPSTLDEYCLLAALGGISKQLNSFNEHHDLQKKINDSLAEKGYILEQCGDQVHFYDHELKTVCK